MYMTVSQMAFVFDDGVFAFLSTADYALAKLPEDIFQKSRV